MALNSPLFDFSKCNFLRRTKEGCGRAAIYSLTGLRHCYTLEINFNSGRVVNRVPPKFNKNMRFHEFEHHAVASNFSTWYSTRDEPVLYDPRVFKDMGRALG